MRGPDGEAVRIEMGWPGCALLKLAASSCDLQARWDSERTGLASPGSAQQNPVVARMQDLERDAVRIEMGWPGCALTKLAASPSALRPRCDSERTPLACAASP